MGYIPGEPALPDDMRGGEFIRFLAAYRGMRGTGRAGELCERFELDASGRIRRMSKGMKQKVAIVCALMHDPAVLILDEPTSGLDPLMQNRFIDLILEEKQRGKTVLMSSHMFEEVERTCARVGILREGRLAAVEEIGTLKARRSRTYSVTLSTPDAAAAFCGRARPAGAGCAGLHGDGARAGRHVRSDRRDGPVSGDVHRFAASKSGGRVPALLRKGGAELMNGVLFRRSARSLWKTWVVFAAVLSLYVSMITAMFDPKLNATLDEIVTAMPQLMNMVGMQAGSSSLGGFLINYLYGFLLLLLPLVFSILAANRLVARWVDTGSMAYLLASPNTRARVGAPGAGAHCGRYAACRLLYGAGRGLRRRDVSRRAGCPRLSRGERRAAVPASGAGRVLLFRLLPVQREPPFRGAGRGRSRAVFPHPHAGQHGRPAGKD